MTTTQTSPEFLLQWTDEQFDWMQSRIEIHFAKRPIRTYHSDYPQRRRTFLRLEGIFGLAYTSSSSYAGYWINNTEVYSNDHPGYKYIGFALSIDGKGYAILWDKEEKELIIEL